MKKHGLLLLLLLLIPAMALGSDEGTDSTLNENPSGVSQSREEQGYLPRILLVGDSIMDGYKGKVQSILKDKATIDNWITGMHLNSEGLHEQLKRILAQGPYDVIHFNIGLHGWQEGRIPKGKYELLLREYVDIYREEAPNSKLIWCSTTQITNEGNPFQLDTVNNTTIVRRNAIADRVMNEYGIETNDLYALMSDKLEFMRGDKFHWDDKGINIQARRVAEIIEKTLANSIMSKNE